MKFHRLPDDNAEKNPMTKVAVIQKPPVLLHRDKTIDLVVDSVAEAAGQGATLIVFPEAFVPGYPTWMWRLRPFSGA